MKQITMSDVRLVAGEGKLSAHDVLAAVNGVLRMREHQQFWPNVTAMIAGIIEDEIGGEVCTKEWAWAAAERIACALRNDEQKPMNAADVLRTFPPLPEDEAAALRTVMDDSDEQCAAEPQK